MLIDKKNKPGTSTNKSEDKKMELLTVTCCECEEVITGQDIAEHEGELYCEDCFSDKFFECESCNDVVENGEGVVAENSENLCTSCYEENYITCSSCDAESARDEVFEYRNSFYCPDCTSRAFADCYSCEEPSPRGNMYYENDELYCRSCYRDQFRECVECESMCPIDDMIYDDDTGDHYCEDCEGDHTRSPIRRYNYTPTFNLYKETWENTVYLGMELEVNCIEDKTDETAIAFTAWLEVEGLSKYFYLKHDGSISHGFEIVTQPLTLQYKHNKVNMYKILNKLKELGCTSYKKGQCGLHIHVGMEVLTKRDISKMVFFMSANDSIIARFSKRKNREYCGAYHYDHKMLLYDFKLSRVSSTPRYAPLNTMTGKETVEFRIFRGTLALDRILATQQFVDAIVYFIKSHSVASLRHDSWGKFLQYIAIQGRYGHLVKYINKMNREQLERLSKVKDKHNKTAEYGISYEPASGTASVRVNGNALFDVALDEDDLEVAEQMQRPEAGSTPSPSTDNGVAMPIEMTEWVNRMIETQE